MEANRSWSFGPNTLFQNDGTGTFRDVTHASAVHDYGFGMSASPGDYDNDGDLDLYVSNVYSGTTWYLQHSIPQLFWVRLLDLRRTLSVTLAGLEILRNTGGLTGAIDVGKKFGQGNSLLENVGGGKFRSVGVDASYIDPSTHSSELAHWCALPV